MKYIDIHSHLNLEPLYGMRGEVVERMREKGVQTVTIGVDYETSKKAIDLSDEFPDVCIGATIGQHPNDNPEEVFDYEKFLKLAQHPKVLAIGECGLDYFRLTGDEVSQWREKARQASLFLTHIKLAQAVQKPLMIHARPSKGEMDTYEDVLQMLEEENFTGKVNFHFFVGDLSIAKRIIERGWSMSFDGPITFAREYDEVIDYIPLEQIMCETDAPFAAPVPYRGKTCEPWMVEEVVKKIAEIKKLPIHEVNGQLMKNISQYYS